MCMVCSSAASTIFRAGGARYAVHDWRDPVAGRPLVLPRSVRGTQADVIFRNGPIHTMVAGAAPAEALAVKAGRIVAVGDAGTVDGFRGPDTKIIDLAGAALLPGFVEPHMHASMAVMDDWLDLGPFANATLTDALERLRGAAQAAEPGEWLRGQLLDPALMPGPPITRQLLDTLAPDNPVFVLESNGHIAYANSLALDLGGIGPQTPDPPQGRYVRRADGELTGRLEEGPAFRPVVATLPMPDGPQMASRVRALFERAATVGCTSLNDAGVGAGGPQDVDLLGAVMRDDPPVRYSGLLTSDQMPAWIERGLSPGHGDDRLRFIGIKLWSDGSNQGRTGYQREPYLGSDSRGALNYSAELLTSGVRQAHELGWQVAVHANGDAAIDTTLDVFEEVLAHAPRPDHRHRIEHCSILHPGQIARMHRLGVSPSFLIGHVHYWGRAFRDDILGPERAMLYDPCASALRGGLRISLHSDYNVTPLNPLSYVDTAVNRRMRDGGEVLNPAERISVADALRAVTLDAAWQCRSDHLVGSLEVGKYADLVMLDRDPLAVAPEAIGSLRVVETWLEGERRYAA